MATPNTLVAPATESGLQLPLLPSERRPGDFAERDRVLALYYRTWMDDPELIEGTVTDVYEAARPDVNGSLGFVSIQSAKTPDLRTGRFIGLDVNSATLIPEDVLPHMEDEDFLRTWVLDGPVDWPGEREALEEKLRERVTQGNLSLTTLKETVQPIFGEHDDADGHSHPTRARSHRNIVPGSSRFKVAAIRPSDFSMDNN